MKYKHRYMLSEAVRRYPFKQNCNKIFFNGALNYKLVGTYPIDIPIETLITAH